MMIIISNTTKCQKNKNKIYQYKYQQEQDQHIYIFMFFNELPQNQQNVFLFL